MSKQTGLQDYAATPSPEASRAERARRPRPGLGARIHTFDSLKERNYRWLWLGMLGSFAGMQMQMVARGWLVVDRLDGSALDLGIVTSSTGAPLLLFSLFGGVVSDRFSKRNVLIVTQSCTGLVALFVAILILTDVVQIWHIILSSILSGTIFAFNMPGRQGLISELVSRENLTNAVALNSAGMNLNRIAAPGLAGVLVGSVGIEGVYFLMVGCYAFAALSVMMIPATGPSTRRSRGSLTEDLKAGLNYVRSSPVLSSLLILAFAPLIFAQPYQALLPLFAKEVLDVGSGGFGILIGAVGVGALVGTLGLASLSNLRRRGVLMASLLVTFGMALILFAQSTSLYLSLGALFLVGVGSMGYSALNQTLLLTNTTPEMRGRVTSIYMMSFGLMPLGVLPMGAAADAISPSAALTMGAGLLMVSTLAVMAWRPQLRRLR